MCERLSLQWKTTVTSVSVKILAGDCACRVGNRCYHGPMRLWSLHPVHLDRQGLLACWREALLAQKVLAGKTRGYRNHPQLTRFKEHPDPLAAIGCYLGGVQQEATARGYNFDATKILVSCDGAVEKIPVTDGQLAYEWEHLGAKLALRSPEFVRAPQPTAHFLFVVVSGGIAPWEVTG